MRGFRFFPLVLALTALAACSGRPIEGKKGCVRQSDCLGHELCDRRTGSCVSEASVDAGPCGATLAGCHDDALNNRAPQCASNIPSGGQFYSDVIMCPTITDYFGFTSDQSWPLQAMAWPVTPVDLQLSLQYADLADIVTETNTSTALAYVAAAPLDPNSFLVEVVAPTNAVYDLQVITGPPCTADNACATQRCDPLIPNPFNLSGAVPLNEITRGGACVPNNASACGDRVTEPNTRQDAFMISNGVQQLFGTCLRDVDWGRFQLDGMADTVEIRVKCTNSDALFLPHLMILSETGDVEWAELLVDAQIGVESVRQVNKLQAGTHLLRLMQMAGHDEMGSCNLKVSWGADTCMQDTDCTGAAARFQRTRCFPSGGGACVRPP